MTPFDPDALLAILSAFYPDVSTASLAKARAERPGVFSGGSLIGDGSQLQLPDGRIFDVIGPSGWQVVAHSDDPAAAGVWDGNRIAAFFLSYGLVVAPSVISQWEGYLSKWGWKNPNYFLFRISHAQELVDAGKADPLPPDTGSGDPFALEDGPLTPIDEAINFFGFGSAPTMESIVSDQLGALDGSDAQLDGVQGSVESFDPAGASASIDDGSLEDAADAHANASAAANTETIDDVAGATEGQGAGIDPIRGGYDETPPPDITAPDPGDPPGHEPGEPNNPPPA